ncbi:SHOCT domain-containing protein [Weissella thailandensis]|nr:SHOCT domain-containing protein [Weissella thailandensis]NKY90110.1 SHOCT domain-containing protein [Weissella thailandensis]RDS60187.1 SHOCT domain-containing protein [Weissella thailandensis]
MNYNNLTIYNSVLLNHVNSIAFVAPLFIFIELAVFEVHYLIDYIDKKENSKNLTKILVVVTNLLLAFYFSIELMAQPWKIIEPIITVCTAIFIPYIAWLLKKYGSEKNKKNPSPADELLKYKELLDKGAITQKEFDNQKANLLPK